LHFRANLTDLLLEKVTPVLALAELIFLGGIKRFQVQPNWLLHHLNSLEYFDLLILGWGDNLIQINFELLIVGEEEVCELLLGHLVSLARRCF